MSTAKTFFSQVGGISIDSHKKYETQALSYFNQCKIRIKFSFFKGWVLQFAWKKFETTG
jgi:hypothetical protein